MKYLKKFENWEESDWFKVGDVVRKKDGESFMKLVDGEFEPVETATVVEVDVYGNLQSVNLDGVVIKKEDGRLIYNEHGSEYLELVY
ncbi:MAG: hypothetical protein SLAVMIC_00483 [uncultured marine phage]|uniref:Uncharacterized protein n=1 Tax=uncultured marine phage TaxID=707152 RepID=A0A8D9CCA9_9VIRU|nr:MAG: hypothetical protein SLAVMIC_00483 [uncultured marine phage]